MTASAAGLVALAAFAIPLAHADEDDLEQRQRDVEGRIDDAASDVEEASQEATRATRALQSAQADLAAARGDLVDVRARLGEARERDVQLTAELARAEADLEAANAALLAGEQAVEDQRVVVRSQLISTYTGGDPRLRAIGSLLESTSLEDISDRRLAQQVITGRQTFNFEHLEDVEDDLVDEQAAVESSAEAVEAKRLEAAEHLAQMRAMYAEAGATKLDIERLVGTARAARQDALAARAADRVVLRQLRAQEARIKQRLVELAAQQRNQAGFQGDSGGFLATPVDGYVTSPFGYRTHPIYGYYALHDGTDFGAGCGTPLVASAAGTVIDTYYSSSYGNRLFLSVGNVNGKNLVLIYNHLSGYAAGEGERLDRGETLGYVGTTGWSTGCHLHYTVMADGVAVDPMTYL